MKFISILNDIESKNNSIKFKVGGISYKNKKTDKAIIESLTRLAFIFYVFDDMRNAELVTDKLASIPFENDYDYWTWIEYAISLRAEISQLDGDLGKFNNSIKKITDVLGSGEGLQKKIRNNVHNRFMAGEGIELDESVLSGKKESFTDVFDFRLIYLMKLMKIKVMGGSKEYSTKLAEDNIINNVAEMKSLFFNMGEPLDEIRPFK